MSAVAPLLVFRLDSQRYALPLPAVEHVVRAVEITPLPRAPAIVLGVIEVEGRVLPVLNVRRRFGLAEREIGPADHFVIAKTARRTVVLMVDEALNVIERPSAQVVATTEIVPGAGQIQGIIQLEDGLVLIHDLEAFLSLDEADSLDEAMQLEAVHGS
jgi:purine-binding chemotaxis protein CheW